MFVGCFSKMKKSCVVCCFVHSSLILSLKHLIMNDLIPVKAECHSGYKADEYTKRFWWDSIQYEISEILDRWYQGENSPEFPAANYFKIRTKNAKTFILKQELTNEKWYLWIKGESLHPDL